MAWRKLTDLQWLIDAYRVDKHSPGFEKRPDSKREDAKRAKLARKAIMLRGLLFTAAEAKALSDRLGYEARGEAAPDSLACSQRMGRYRICVCGHLWKLIDETKPSRCSRIDLIPKGWRFTLKQLLQVDPTKLLKALRTDLYRCGARDGDGWLFGAIHGEFDDQAGEYQLHFHGVAAEGMVDAADKLRKRRKYKAGDGVKRRVVISRKPLLNLPYRLTYVLKSFWPCRPIRDVDGERQRSRKSRRIKEPYHTLYLLWLDRWSLNDVTMLVHMSVGKDGFVVTSRRRHG